MMNTLHGRSVGILIRGLLVYSFDPLLCHTDLFFVPYKDFSYRNVKVSTLA